eukprot:TRINITY_DN5112_c0_g1_i1.p1 TRINITY_DN5112_c0_g1~~TRINITY_DN5112_c0_g1_i1.p1  ORF type:complete len:1131 (+),score=232.44 TRINITY_DN5112_c0_g1_i1:86-3478(+)
MSTNEQEAAAASAVTAHAERETSGGIMRGRSASRGGLVGADEEMQQRFNTLRRNTSALQRLTLFLEEFQENLTKQCQQLEELQKTCQKQAELFQNLIYPSFPKGAAPVPLPFLPSPQVEAVVRRTMYLQSSLCVPLPRVQALLSAYSQLHERCQCVLSSAMVTQQNIKNTSDSWYQPNAQEGDSKAKELLSKTLEKLAGSVVRTLKDVMCDLHSKLLLFYSDTHLLVNKEADAFVQQEPDLTAYRNLLAAAELASTQLDETPEAVSSQSPLAYTQAAPTTVSAVSSATTANATVVSAASTTVPSNATAAAPANQTGTHGAAADATGDETSSAAAADAPTSDVATRATLTPTVAWPATAPLPGSLSGIPAILCASTPSFTSSAIQTSERAPRHSIRLKMPKKREDMLHFFDTDDIAPVAVPVRPTSPPLLADPSRRQRITESVRSPAGKILPKLSSSPSIAPQLYWNTVSADCPGDTYQHILTHMIEGETHYMSSLQQLASICQTLHTVKQKRKYAKPAQLYEQTALQAVQLHNSLQQKMKSVVGTVPVAGGAPNTASSIFLDKAQHLIDCYSNLFTHYFALAEMLEPKLNKNKHISGIPEGFIITLKAPQTQLAFYITAFEKLKQLSKTAANPVLYQLDKLCFNTMKQLLALVDQIRSAARLTVLQKNIAQPEIIVGRHYFHEGELLILDGKAWVSDFTGFLLSDLLLLVKKAKKEGSWKIMRCIQHVSAVSTSPSGNIEEIVLSLSGAGDGEVRLRTCNGDSAKLWVEAFQKMLQQRIASKVFGEHLETISRRHFVTACQTAILPNTCGSFNSGLCPPVVPKLVAEVVACLSQNAEVLLRTELAENDPQLQHFAYQVDTGVVVDFSRVRKETLGLLLAHFLRSLPETIIPKNSFVEFESATRAFMEEIGNKERQLDSVLQAIPLVNQFVLEQVLGLLHAAAASSGNFEVAANQLGAMWGPLIYGGSSRGGSAVAQPLSLLIQQFNSVFQRIQGRRDAAWKDLFSRVLFKHTRACSLVHLVQTTQRLHPTRGSYKEGPLNIDGQFLWCVVQPGVLYVYRSLGEEPQSAIVLKGNQVDFDALDALALRVTEGTKILVVVRVTSPPERAEWVEAFNLASCATNSVLAQPQCC